VTSWLTLHLLPQWAVIAYVSLCYWSNVLHVNDFPWFRDFKEGISAAVGVRTTIVGGVSCN